MADPQTFTTSLQESIVTIVGFVTDDPSRYITKIIDPQWFDEPYREIVRRSLTFWQDHDRAPGSEHIDDLFDEILHNPADQLHLQYTRILKNMNQLKERMHSAYIRDRVHIFARRQKLRMVVHDAAQILHQQEVTEEEFDQIDQMFGDVMNYHPVTADPGFRMSNVERSLAFLNSDADSGRLKIGIDMFDDNGINPRKGEVLLFLAPVNRGKSMWLHFVGRAGMNRGWNTLHITLENSETATAMRYIQTNLQRSKNTDLPKITRFSTEGKRLAGLYTEANPAIPMFPKEESFGEQDHVRDNLRSELGKRLTQTGEYRWNNLMIKSFETGELSYEKYEAYLDQLAYSEKFVPDLVIIDYPWLMDVGGRDSEKRLAYGRLSQKLRGSAIRRNYALSVASQLSQKGSVAEDYSQLWTCDYAVKYLQTDMEAKLGLARLFVQKARNEKAYFTVLISQNYSTSTFCLDSVMMINDDKGFEQMLKQATPTIDNILPEDDDLTPRYRTVSDPPNGKSRDDEAAQ